MKLKDQIFPAVGFALLFLSNFFFNEAQENADFIQLMSVFFGCILAYIVFIALYNWLHFRPASSLKVHLDNFNLVHKKISASVDKLIQKERFIDQAILNILEREARHIWVVTTNLANELLDEDLAKAVEENLKDGKLYTYFLPHPDDSSHRANRNLKDFKRLSLYQNYSSQIDFIRLPPNTFFLLEEVVIYNPEEEELISDTRGVNGFTYYENKDEGHQKLHMKIEGKLLLSLVSKLHQYLQNSGLTFAIEGILTETSYKFTDSEKLFLVKLISSRRISDKDKFNNFINSIKEREDMAIHSSFIKDRLQKYLI